MPETRKWPKHDQNGTKTKNNVTFIYPTLKVRKVKVLSVFWFVGVLVHFWPFSKFYLKKANMAKIWPQRQNFQKIRPLYFMILKKLEK